MFQRNITDQLKQWAAKKNRKPLVLRGARQVGKTTAVKIFADSFDTCIFLNLDRPDDRRIFENKESPFEEVLRAIFFHKNISPDPDQRILIFIDEIQNSPRAVSLLRYFHEDAPHLYVIAAGSLLETLIDRHISFPVGRVEYLFLYPLTFDEFVNALGETAAYSALFDQYPLPDYAHIKLKELFRIFCLIGGMPEIVADYAAHRDIVRLSAIFDALFTAYADDVEKYASSKSQAAVIRHAISTIPLEAGGRIRFHGFGRSSYGSKEIGEALRILEKAMLIRLVYPSTTTTLPIAPNFRKSPRLQFLDTGMLNYRAGLQKNIFNTVNLESVYEGKIIEHLIGQELTGRCLTSSELPLFWVRQKKQSNAEVDFIIRHRDKILPLEVKSGASGRLRSLHQFIDAAPHALAARFYGGQFSIQQAATVQGKPFTLYNLPHYAVCRLNDLLTVS